MNILFCAYTRRGAGDGVEKKICGQMAALRKLGHTVAGFTMEDGMLYLETKEAKRPLLEVKEGALGEYLAIEKGLYMVAKERLFPAHLCYIRRIFCTPFHLRALRMLKQRGICTVEELPTYPYDRETKSFTSFAFKMAAFVERRCRRHYKRYLDYFATTSRDSEIFGVPAIHIENGVEVNKIPFVRRRFEEKDKIRLIAVSAMAPWHGYERLIEGLHNYVQDPAAQKTIEICMVGEGACLDSWRKLANGYNLSHLVQFCGYKTGKELDDLFAKSDIAISALGWYKKDVHCGSELKNREYMARGIPFIYSSDEMMFSPQEGFCMQVADEAAPVDMKDVLGFYEDLEKQLNVSQRLRWFAEKYFRWEVWMDRVVRTALPDGE